MTPERVRVHAATTNQEATIPNAEVSKLFVKGATAPLLTASKQSLSEKNLATKKLRLTLFFCA